MGKTLNEIAQELKASNKKSQLIYAFNGTGKTRLSREFKELISPKSQEGDEHIGDLEYKKILYYSSFTEDLFYWDNDLESDSQIKLKIHRNAFTNWVFMEQGLEETVSKTFQRYTNEKLTPNFSPDFSEVTFSYATGDTPSDNIKISKGEESNFIWSIFYSLLQQVVAELNIAEIGDRSTDKFNNLEYIFIDDPVSSLDENHLIELAVDIAQLIKSSESGLKFIITTHNPLFYNVLHNEMGKATKYFLNKYEDGTYDLVNQSNDSPFSYHLYLKSELENAISQNLLKKYHFNFIRNILEKTSTFLGYREWKELLPQNDDGLPNPYEKRIIDISSHSSHSSEEIAELSEQDKAVLRFIFQHIQTQYKFK